MVIDLMKWSEVVIIRKPVLSRVVVGLMINSSAFFPTLQ